MFGLWGSTVEGSGIGSALFPKNTTDRQFLICVCSLGFGIGDSEGFRADDLGFESRRLRLMVWGVRVQVLELFPKRKKAIHR